MSRFRLSRRADRDLLDIFAFSIEMFGPTQAERYRDSLGATFDLIGRHPEMGRPTPSVGEGVRRHEHGSHIILYELAVDGVLILALFHRRSLPPRLE